jgi:hypothetical protein
VRRLIEFCLALVALMLLAYAHAQPADQARPTDDSLRLYAVDIWQDPPQSWGPGRGVYLGKGLVITAAHVVTPVAHTKPHVRIAGMDLPARAIREGDFNRVDLTLLSIDEQKLPIYLQMRRMPLCDNKPWPGEPVIVAIPEGSALSQYVALVAHYQKGFSTVIRDVATTGNSGSGVFDAGQKCLLGIISLKIYQTPSNEASESEHKDIAKYFVPASIIQAFIPPEYRFYGDCHALENCYAFRGIGSTGIPALESCSRKCSGSGGLVLVDDFRRGAETMWEAKSGE